MTSTTMESSAPCARREALDACVLVPAFDAEATLGQVLAELRGLIDMPVIVVDDGSRDATASVAARHGADVVRHGDNRGKGAALVTGLRRAARRGHRCAVTVDADGQHPAGSARAVLEGAKDPAAFVLGVRDLVRDGAPRLNQFSNGVSNFFLSRLSGRTLLDTQCGLRRYPVAETLALGARATGYDFEAEVILRALAGGARVVEVPIEVVYPSGSMRRTHFHAVRDPARIVRTVARTVVSLRLRRQGR